MTAPVPVRPGPDRGGAARRELTVVVLFCLAGGLLALWATTRQWAVLSTPRPAPLPAVRGTVGGGDAAPLAAALTLVALAGAAALPAARGILRAGVGLLLLLSGAGIVAAGLAVLTGGVPGESAVTEVRLTVAWPVLTMVGGAVVALAGLVTAIRGRRWSALGRRYEAPAVATRSHGSGGLWDAQDRGEDPTGHPGPGSAPQDGS
ncbi:MAG TPA: Trp biosynthesis-associated membrane protein [Mycobacteriales bacterium]|jgi:hypothetical protein|nr:Trp biosynthesis-associated membrane protein [Mycobacteriales bacterium]